MNSKRAMWKVLLGVAGMALLVTNCTVKTDGDDDDTSCTPGMKKSGCKCPDDSVGYQTCQDDGTYDACYCAGPNVGGSSSGGAASAGANSSIAGKGGDAATNGGAPSASAGVGGEGGEAGSSIVAPDVNPNDCYDCLNKLCTPEWDACVLEDENNPETAGKYCLSSTLNGSGQIESILACIEAERSKGAVKRDVVRACGSSLGQSTDPSFFLWPPDDMTAATAGVINCMADAPDEVQNPGRWADSTNIPNSGAPKPWLDMTCAKLSCTSAQ